MKCEMMWTIKAALKEASVVIRFLSLYHFTNNYIFSPTPVYGPSMLPTLNLTGDVVLSDHFSHRLGRLGVGDVVLVKLPIDPNKSVVKRIVGVEGDRVNFFDPHATDLLQSLVVCSLLFDSLIDFLILSNCGLIVAGTEGTCVD